MLLEKEEDDFPFSDNCGIPVDRFSVSINSKDYFDLSANIDKKPYRNFIRPDMPEYSELIDRDIFNLQFDEKVRLIAPSSHRNIIEH